MTYTVRRLYDRPCTLLLDDRPLASLYCTDAEADALLAALNGVAPGARQETTRLRGVDLYEAYGLNDTIAHRGEP